MKYKVGLLVADSQLGLGKVLRITGDRVTMILKDQTNNLPISNVAVMPMANA